MDPATIIAVAALAATIIIAFVAYIQWRENHADRKGSKLRGIVKQIVQDESKPLDDHIHDHTLRLTQFGGQLNRLEDLAKEIGGNQRDISDKVSQMGVKVDMYWTTLESLAMNSAKNLHQPDPLRRHVDHLLEAFMEGTLTESERTELRKILVNMRNFEPSWDNPEVNRARAISQLGFPVFPGEQTQAVILLSTMDLVDPSRMASMGHATHRSSAHRKEDSSE